MGGPTLYPLGRHLYSPSMLYRGVLITLVLMCMSVPGLTDESPLSLEGTEELSGWEFEIVAWEDPFVFNDALWLVYEELSWGYDKLIKYRVYDGVWSSPEALSNKGEFIAALGDDGELTVLLSEEIISESGTRKNICMKTGLQEWSSSLCSETGLYLGSEFVVERSDGLWLLWSRRGFWEYQVWDGNQWTEPEVLAVMEAYDEIVEVIQVGDDVWIFYKTGTSDIYCRVLGETLSEPQPLVTEGFPYVYDVCLVDTSVWVFLEVQEAETEKKTLVYTVYDGVWSPLEAVAAPEEGYLAGGSCVLVSDGRLFVFWNGTASVESTVDIFYRVYDGSWSRVYALTDTPDVWETVPMAAEYKGNLIIIWREKESHKVSASYAQVRDVPLERGELRPVNLKVEPEQPTWNPWALKIQEYAGPILVVSVLIVLGALIYMKRRVILEKSDTKEKKKEERKKERKK
jgi:hypothetical protein